MAVAPHVIYDGLPAILRLAEPTLSELQRLAFRRYPHWEWGTYARFGWREVGDTLVVTLVEIDPPQPGDLNEAVGHVSFQEPYTLRQALGASEHPFALGVVHSHPSGGAPQPSDVDDDMDTYLSDYLKGFAPGRPFVSLILSQVGGVNVVSGRIWWKGRWHTVGRALVADAGLETWPEGRPPPRPVPTTRVARLTSTYGEDAYRRLRGSTVAVIGAGGTGSPAIHVLARAGVGRIISVDPDYITDSNLERVHGSRPEHAEAVAPKVAVAREMVSGIDADIEFLGIRGYLPQAEVIDAVVQADVVLGCTDKHSSRLALSDLVTRYLVPVIDTGAAMEGANGVVTGQIGQLTRLLPADRCVICRGMVDTQRASQELMTEDEREARRAAADAARKEGRDAAGYWREMPQINTVGHLTTVVGALAAGYAIGWITRRFEPPFERLQMNLSAPLLGTVECEPAREGACTCRTKIGWADQGIAWSTVSAPVHWPQVEYFRSV